jgi:arylsulfatase G
VPSSRLAAEGVRFTDFHVGASVCTPSRAALLTGRLGLRTGVTGNYGPNSLYGMDSREITLANMLNEAGYSSHMIGKWHLGHNTPHNPTFRGFSSWLGLPYSGDMGCLNDTPQSCKPSYDRHHGGQPACPPLCSNQSNEVNVAIPLFDCRTNCSHRSCNECIIQQPFNVFDLNHRYTERATQIISSFKGS